MTNSRKDERAETARTENYLTQYLRQAPVSLALVRAMECRIMDRMPFAHPILDLGCGDGLFASTLFKNKDFVDCAVDRDPGEVEHCYKKGVYREIKVGEAEDIPYGEGEFRFIIANDLLSHVDDPALVLRESWRVLAPGGMICMSVPTLVPDFHAGVVKKFLRTVTENNVLELFNHNIGSYFRLNRISNLRKWKASLAECGFEAVQSMKYASLSAIAIQMIMSYYLYRGMAYKKTLGRYIPFPDLHEKIVTPITSWLLKSVYDDGSYEGENYVILARKAA